MATSDEFELATMRAKKFAEQTPRAVSARYDRRLHGVLVQLNTNLGIFFSPKDVEGVEHATAAQLDEIEISPSGYGLHFPKLDADIYLPALMEGVFGSERWTASRMGAWGGKAKSTAKTMAARKNGRKGGRPAVKKAVAARV